MLDLVKGKHGGSCAFVTFSGDQSGTESAHDPGNVGTHSLTVCDLFEGTQHGIVIERTALHHDVFSQLGSIGHLDYLK